MSGNNVVVTTEVGPGMLLYLQECPGPPLTEKDLAPVPAVLSLHSPRITLQQAEGIFQNVKQAT